jgi:hypothetical protein
MSELPRSAHGAHPRASARMSRLTAATRTRPPLVRRAGASLARRGRNAAGRADAGRPFCLAARKPEGGAAA